KLHTFRGWRNPRQSVPFRTSLRRNYRVEGVGREKNLHPISEEVTYLPGVLLLSAVLRLLQDVIDHLGHVTSKLVERGHHLGAPRLENVCPVAQARDLLAQHLGLRLQGGRARLRPLESLETLETRREEALTISEPTHQLGRDMLSHGFGRPLP